MRLGRLKVALAVVALAASPLPLFGECKLLKFAEFPVTMTGLRPIVNAKINGTEVRFLIDSGAFFSILSPAAAAQLGLRLHPAPFGFTVIQGIAGGAETRLATVTFTLAKTPIDNVEFLVGGSDIGSDVVGVIGQNLLQMGDVEYDFANGTMRFMRPQDCRGRPLAYWATAQPFSSIDTLRTDRLHDFHTVSTASVNGRPIRVGFDTGASTSVLTLRAAERAGVKPDSPGVTAGGNSYGAGSGMVQTWIAPFASFKIGDEEVHNTRLRIGAYKLPDVDMLLGADFFLSHRVYIADSQDKVYFTYNGGPVFNLESLHPSAAAVGQTEQNSAEPGDAAAFGRRGSAFAARHEYERAIADLTRASELDPNEGRYFYERGEARLNNSQADLAMGDFDQALKLKPDDVPALTARAELRLERSDNQGALADLDAADKAAAKQADVRLHLGELYERAGAFAQAAVQYDQWLTAHAEDARSNYAMTQRCWARASSGQNLDRALSDCDSARRATPKSPRPLIGLGLVQLQLGDLDKSISTYDAALRLDAKNVWARYGRGVAKVRKGMTSDGEADVAAATAVNPDIVDEAKKHAMVR